MDLGIVNEFQADYSLFGLVAGYAGFLKHVVYAS